MQLNEPRRPALFPSQKCYLNGRKLTKILISKKARALVNNCFFQYPSVFGKTYVRCVVHREIFHAKVGKGNIKRRKCEVALITKQKQICHKGSTVNTIGMNIYNVYNTVLSQN